MNIIYTKKSFLTTPVIKIIVRLKPVRGKRN